MLIQNARSIPSQWRYMAKIFAALGDEQRQCILLSFEPGERLNVSQIVEGSTLARSTVSHHLRILSESGVLLREKIGKEVYFEINVEGLLEVFGNVQDYLQLLKRP